MHAGTFPHTLKIATGARGRAPEVAISPVWVRATGSLPMLDICRVSVAYACMLHAVGQSVRGRKGELADNGRDQHAPTHTSFLPTDNRQAHIAKHRKLAWPGHPGTLCCRVYERDVMWSSRNAEGATLRSTRSVDWRSVGVLGISLVAPCLMSCMLQ